jgi:hypothetical protein
MTKYLQYGLALVVGSLYLVFIPEDDVTNIMALTAILFFGVPHGAIDHKIHLKFSKKSNIKKFILIYILVGLGFLLWWVLRLFVRFVRTYSHTFFTPSSFVFLPLIQACGGSPHCWPVNLTCRIVCGCGIPSLRTSTKRKLWNF